ncbi:hypothetical protein COL154_014289, partial [Colletotrichum chrysophilum]
MTALCDSITVLRDAKRVGDSVPRPYSSAKLVKDMIGRELESEPAARSGLRVNDEAVVLRVSGLASPPEVRNVDLEVRPGEIVGLAGLVGSGRTETAECIAGLRDRRAGEVSFHDRPLSKSTADVYRDGVVYVSEDRAKSGSFLKLSVASNITAGIIDRIGWRGRNGIISRKREQGAVREGVKKMDVRMASSLALLESL